ncbi:hypothetical protein F5Y12DRAFT_719798 [Xylaria sp. FL1777]|nr:hypothetical protein F5Y12DRAFT_719798 [Xylaria sp. FL1777]
MPPFDLAMAQTEAEQEFEEDVHMWMDWAPKIPQDINYSWFPFCKALAENHRDVTGIFQPPPPPSVPQYVQQKHVDKQTGRKKDVLFVEIPADKVPIKDPTKGSWDHVVYLPEWMDPDYKETFMKTPAGGWRKNTVREAISNLRPALRLEDAIRNPTNYALRFGIAEGRLDGRSRMSPTWSKTRDPIDDFVNQVNQLDDSERELAVDVSRERLAARNELPAPGQEILPEVMEALLRMNGVLTNAQLKDKVEQAARTGQSLDHIVDELGKTNPRIKKVHQVFLQNALDDQDYQRILLSGLTTDEMIQYNHHSMSDDAVTDLDNPIHPLFQRNRWLDSRWKGSAPETPKLAYNIGGTREEWDVGTNDVLWNALQPALQLVSMILSKSPPHLEALCNLNTRQPVNPLQDGRKVKSTPTLTKYVLEKDIDMNLTYPAIRELKEVHNYDWKSNILRYLSRCLELDIESGYTLPYTDLKPDTESHRDEPCDSFSVGSAGLYNEGSKHTIRIRLAAEIIWPLLVPQYSKSEKMACSFEIGITLLHEFAGQDPEVTRLLLSLKGLVFDMDSNFGEPYFEDYPAAEVGHQLEHSLWGVNGFPLEFPNRHYVGLLIMTHQESHPYTRSPYRIGTEFPLLHYYRTVPLDHVAKFFRKSFWDKEFEAYGFTALKMKRDNSAPQKNLWHYPDELDRDLVVAYYGDDLAQFLTAVPFILHVSRHRVLAKYLRALVLEAAYRKQYDKWWDAEVSKWSSNLLHPLPANINFLYANLQEAQDLHRKLHVSNWSDENQGFDGMINTAGEWREKFRYGGQVMQSLSSVDYMMQDDIGYMQRMVFYYPLAKSRGEHSDLARNITVSNLHERLSTFRQHATRIAEEANKISNIPEVSINKDEWEKWRARFEFSAKKYQELLSVLDEVTKVNGKPFDIDAKAQFDRLPTADWKYASERYKKMAAYEYNRADVAVRNTIDDFFDVIQAARISRKPKSSVRRLRGALQSLSGVGANAGEPTGSPFDFNIPILSPVSARPQSGLPTLTQPLPTNTPTPGNRAVFGVPGGLGMAPSSLDGEIPRRLLGSRSAAERLAYQDYVSNLLTSPDPEQTSSNVFTSGVPQPLPNLSPGRKQLVRGSGQSQFQLFPNPFVSRVVMTSEAIAFQEQKRLAEQATRMTNKAAGNYVARSLWREKRRRDSDDDDSSPEKRPR